MSRTLPYLSELRPELFVEVSPELAAERGLVRGGGPPRSPAPGRVLHRHLDLHRVQGLRWPARNGTGCPAGCLDVCPTGALFRTEFGTVVVQEDICNGCGYCVSGCPYGVIDRRHGDGRAWKCTLCYDRLRGGLEPACAKACPTKSIQFGPLDELRERAGRAA